MRKASLLILDCVHISNTESKYVSLLNICKQLLTLQSEHSRDEIRPIHWLLAWKELASNFWLIQICRKGYEQGRMTEMVNNCY